MKPLLIILLLMLASLSYRCSSPVAAGSSDHGNAFGMIIRPGGDPATEARVLLLPDTFNYITDSASAGWLETYTDSLGRFTFDSIPRGTYCLSAHDGWSSSSLVRKALDVNDDTIDVGTLSLSIPGTIYFDIDSMGIAPGTILYFPGLPFFHVVDSSAIQWINGIPSGTVALEGYDPENDTSIDLGIEYRSLEILPGLSLFVPLRMSKPWCIIDSALAVQKLRGAIDTIYLFSAVEPSLHPSGQCRYRFSWGDGVISPWAEDYHAEYAWSKPGIYYVQTQMMVETTCLAWSDAIEVIITGEENDE